MSAKAHLANGHRSKPIAIAIVGIGALFPGSDNLSGFWRDIISGRDLVTEVPPTHWIVEDYYHADPSVPDKTYCKRGAFLSPIDFDPLEFKIPPANLSSTDTSQLLGLKVAKQVVDDMSNGPLNNMTRDRISVILGVASGLELLGEMNSRLQRPIWAKALQESGIPNDQAESICDRITGKYTQWKESTFPGLLGNVVAGRIANYFDLGGTNCTVDAACASSFSALSMAVNELCMGQADLVITGGVDTTNGPFLHTCFSKTPALSPTGDCRPFSDKADGLVIGEGIGMVALKRLEDAERDGDRIYAVLRGIGTSSDGAGKSVFAPLRKGQEMALRRCYDIAGYAPETVTLVEAHGTGTVTGDQVEVDALRQVFDGKSGKRRQWCALGSVKSQIGHTKSAAGVAGLIKAVMALHNRVLPPTIKVDQPDANLDLATSPFYLNTKARPWITDVSHPLRASVSAFGFGGTNFHVALEAYTNPEKKAWKQRTLPSELVLLCADDQGALLARCREVAAQASTAGMLAFFARHSQETFDPTLAARMAVVAEDEKDLEQKIRQAMTSMAENPGQAYSCASGIHYCLSAAQPGALAFLFPGQGSQYLGMGVDLAMHFEGARKIWDRAAAVPMDQDRRLHDIVFPRPVFTEAEAIAQRRELGRTQWAQPAISATSLSILALIEHLGISPHCVGGHSLGEVTALCAAGVLEASDLIKLARKRGELMAGASPAVGAMTVVFQPIYKIGPLIEKWNPAVIVANHNSPQQVTLSGPVAAIEEVEQHLADRGMAAHRLPVSSAFHSEMMRSACDPFLDYLQTLPMKLPLCPTYSNVDTTPYPYDVDKIRQLLVRQIVHPVRFAEGIDAMYAKGVRTFIEMGPGSVLTDLVGQCLAGRPHVAVYTDRKGCNGVTSLWNALGRLSIHGVPMDFSPMWDGYAPVVDPRLKQRSAFSVPLLGCNYARPYPPPQETEAHVKHDLSDAIADSPPKPLSEQCKMEKTAMTLKRSPDPDPAQKPTVTASAQSHGRPMLTNDPPPSAARLTSTGNGHMGAWIKAIEEIQRQTAETHTAFQKSLTDSHMAYLKTAQASTLALEGMITGNPVQSPQISRHVDAPSESLLTRSVQISPDNPPAESFTQEPIVSQISPQEESDAKAPPQATHSEDQVAAPVSTDATPMTDDTISPIPARLDLEALLFGVVAQKTGYPEEVLDINMNLELDLGIDSIKRVEILSAITDEVPDLPEMDTARLAELQTLGDVRAYMQDMSNNQAIIPPSESPSSFDLPQQAPITEPGRYALREVPAPHHGVSITDQLQTGFCAVTDDGTGIAHALSRRLSDMNVDARVVTDIPENAKSVIFLGGLKSCPSPASAIAVNREAFATARKVAGRFATAGGFFATVQDTGGNFGLTGEDATRAWLAGLPGLIKTAAIEWPHATVKAVDLDRSGRSPDELAQVILRELSEGGPEIEVGLHTDGSRFCLESYPSVLDQRYPTINESSVIVVSGGALGVTAAAMIQLASRFHPKIALIGRTLLIDEPDFCREAVTDSELKWAFIQAAQAEGQKCTPVQIEQSTRHVLAVRQIRSTLQALHAAGSEARYFSADIRDASGVGSVLESVRKQWGPITGIVHGAGIIKDKPISEKTMAMFDMVFNTKVLGLHTLLAATAEDPLELICLFSSVAARLGNPGQCDYAMANEVLNKVAHAQARQRSHTCVVKSINWGPWEGGMVSGALKTYFNNAGVPLIPLEAGAHLFVDEIQAAPSDTVEVAIVRSLDKTGLGQESFPGKGLRQ